MQRCYFKEVAESRSKEGMAFKKNYPYIAFSICKLKCDGHDCRCEHYEDRHMSDIEEETAMDSSRLENIWA